MKISSVWQLNWPEWNCQLGIYLVRNWIELKYPWMSYIEFSCLLIRKQQRYKILTSWLWDMEKLGSTVCFYVGGEKKNNFVYCINLSLSLWCSGWGGVFRWNLGFLWSVCLCLRKFLEKLLRTTTRVPNSDKIWVVNRWDFNSQSFSLYWFVIWNVVIGHNLIATVPYFWEFGLYFVL